MSLNCLNGQKDIWSNFYFFIKKKKTPKGNYIYIYLQLLKGLIKHWIYHINCSPSLNTASTHSYKSIPLQNAKLKCKFKVHDLHKGELVARLHVYADWRRWHYAERIYHCLIYPLWPICEHANKRDPWGMDCNNQACSLIWPWPLSVADICHRNGLCSDFHDL